MLTLEKQIPQSNLRKPYERKSGEFSNEQIQKTLLFTIAGLGKEANVATC